MRKKYHVTGGHIKEQKRPKKPKTGKEYNKYAAVRVQAGPDLLMQSLDVPLTPEQSDRIMELVEYGWERRDIAQELGLPKTRVNHEIIRRKGGGAA